MYRQITPVTFFQERDLFNPIILKEDFEVSLKVIYVGRTNAIIPCNADPVNNFEYWDTER